jgi:hypothetical protein
MAGALPQALWIADDTVDRQTRRGNQQHPRGAGEHIPRAGRRDPEKA